MSIPCGEQPSVKLILVGNSGVGKTCLISAYINESFDEKTPPTVAPAYSNCKVKRSDGTVVSVQIWDTAGQEKYSSVSQLFFRDAEVAFICFDSQDQSSVDAVRVWAKKVKTESPRCTLFGIMTKADCLPRDKVVSEFENTKTILKDEQITNFYITSSQTGEGILAPFIDAADLLKTVDSLPFNEVEDELSIQEKKKCC